MSIKTFTPQPTGNQAMDNNMKQIKEILDAIITAIQNLKSR